MDAIDYVTTLSEIEKMSNGANLVRDFLEKYPENFIDTLRSWIQYGEERCSMCMLMVYILKYENGGTLLTMGSDQPILHLAATFHDCQRLVINLLEAEPRLAGQIRQGPHLGLTPLHIIVSKGDIKTTAYLKTMETSDARRSVSQLAVGSRFKGTVLMGETALSAAILKFVPKEISSDTQDLLLLAKVLLAKGAAFDDQNSQGDTVIHTLIRYAHLYPERREQVLEMMAEIQSYLLTPNSKDSKTRGRLYARRVWFCQNMAEMTALQLAATLGEHEIVCFIMELQWIYRTLHDYDGIFETNKYDITEIDTLAKIEWCKNVEKNTSQLLYERESLFTRLKRLFLCHDSVVARRSTPAILEVICEVEVEAACNIISTPVVNKLIAAKWRKYKLWFYCWATFYILSLLFLSVYSSIKFQYVHSLSRNANNNQTVNDSFSGNVSEISAASVKFSPDPLSSPSEMQKIVINAGCFFALSFSILSIYLEFVRSIVQLKPWNLLLVHHNGSYRLLLLLNALALGVDSVWFLVSPATNIKTPMVLALLFGWWFSTFFLRPFKKFSFFTVMLMKVLLGDMLRFFTIIIIALVSFTMAMHLLFLHSQSLPKEFESLPLGCLTMFKLMLGLTDLEILEHADPVWLAVTLFVIYVLLTYVLLINSLIAMMSNTCSEIAGQKSNQWMIQRLSVILFIENMMLCGLVRTSGKKNYFRKNDEGDELEARYVIEDTKLSMLDGGGNLGHDIQSKGHYVSSFGPRRPLSSVEDLWSLSDIDNLSNTSKKSDGRESNLSLAESFVNNVGKKYRQASRKSRSSLPMAHDDSISSQSSFWSREEPKGLYKMFRRFTNTKRKLKSNDGKHVSSRGSEPSDESDNENLICNPNRPLKSILSKPKTSLTNLPTSSSTLPMQSLSSESPEMEMSVADDKAIVKRESVDQSQNERASPEPITSQNLTGKFTRDIEDEVSNSQISNATLSEYIGDNVAQPIRERNLDTLRPKTDDNVESMRTSINDDQSSSGVPNHTIETLPDYLTGTFRHRHDSATEISKSTTEAETVELGTLSETILPRPQRQLIEAHAPDSTAFSTIERRLSEDSAQQFVFIDEGVREDGSLFANNSLKVDSSNKPDPLLKGDDANVEPLNNNVVPLDTTREPRASSDRRDSSAEQIFTEITEDENHGEAGYAHASASATDPQWAALMQSIRTLDREKSTHPTDRKKSSKSISDIKQRRNAFIKGLGSSHDYGGFGDSEDFN
ncbi:transient receptor potential cation channel subfamily V member 3-like [Elysia marginata]|uniref:Transient receptor potential cation channel subfamily V member 3-like n=1 Tax=Elysia marginata TaxID=1093978 RepID=A0AAV4EY33_9GAST|nr:transient receptor potential cation channel subfamily V member 3-like [Elysia marginata]